MSDNAKAAILFVLLLSIALPPVAWTLPDTLPGPLLVLCKFALPFVGLAALAIAGWALFRPDKAPNFLDRLGGEYFERDGFCFTLLPSVLGNLCLINVHYQNKYNRPCKAKVVLRPSQGEDESFATMTIPIDCTAGAYGVASVPWSVPSNHQGEELEFDVAAAVRFPEGQGNPIRFGYGMRVGHADWGDRPGSHAANLAAQGKLLVMSPARAVVSVPTNVAEQVPEEMRIENQTLWRPGDRDDPKLHARVAVLSATM